MNNKLTALILSLFLLTLTACFPESADTVEYNTSPSTTGTTLPQTDAQTETDTQTVTDAQTEAQTEPVKKETKTISFIAMGDNLIHSPIYKQSATGSGKYDFLPKYAGVADMIKNADIAFINQETPMCGEEYGYSNYPQFNTPQQMGYDLISLGFDILCFANNHMADKGAAGLSDMMDFTETLDVMTVGLYRSEDDFNNIRIYEKDGVKISVLAYTYGTNIKGTSENYSTYIPKYTKEVLTRQLAKANEISDFVIVSMHWGKENSSNVTSEQREYAQLLCDLGADVILGHHPHTVQPIEWLQNENGGRTLCYYSLGNGINCQDYLRNMVGITASFNIVCVDGEEPYAESVSCIPVFNYQSYAYKNVKLLLLEDLTESMASSHHCNKTDKKVTVEGAYSIITDTIDMEFLPDYLKNDNNET